jgi:oxygen-dependent protoporphyrinogen oxidase
VESERGDSLRAPRLVLAVPAREAARLLAPLASAATTEFLARLPHAGVRLAHLGFAPGELTLPGGFGFLVPPGATGPGTPRALGCVFASNLFAARAPAGGAALTSFFALEGVQDLDAAAFGDLAAADLARALGLPRAPTPAAQWTTTWREAIPQYEPGHDLRMRAVGEDLAERVPGLVLAGGFTQGVSVEQVVARGRQVAEELLVERRR